MNTNIQSFLAATSAAGPLRDVLRAADRASFVQVSAIEVAHGHTVSAVALETFAVSKSLPDSALDGVSGGVRGSDLTRGVCDIPGLCQFQLATRSGSGAQ